MEFPVFLVQIKVGNKYYAANMTDKVKTIP